MSFMRKLFLFLFTSASISLSAQEYKWKEIKVDGSRTGCMAASAENIKTAIGSFRDGEYVAPNGRVFGENSTVSAVAALVLDAQQKMARVKKVIAHSAQAMPNAKSENMLSRWCVDRLMESVQYMSGKKVHVGICNFGGIRLGMPEGEVILDDILSMFPFRNPIVYLELSGRQLRSIFESMAAGRFEAVGGVRIVVENKRLVSVEIDGAPLDDEKVYGVATVSFLLNGGDGLNLSENALDIQLYDTFMRDVVLEYLENLQAAGKPVTGSEEMCVIFR